MKNWSLYGRFRVGQWGAFAFLVLFVGFICTYRSYCQKVPSFNDVAGDGGVVMILRFHFER